MKTINQWTGWLWSTTTYLKTKTRICPIEKVTRVPIGKFLSKAVEISFFFFLRWQCFSAKAFVNFILEPLYTDFLTTGLQHWKSTSCFLGITQGSPAEKNNRPLILPYVVVHPLLKVIKHLLLKIPKWNGNTPGIKPTFQELSYSTSAVICGGLLHVLMLPDLMPFSFL